jgi:hypothetical protein
MTKTRQHEPFHLLRRANILEMSDQMMRMKHEKEKSIK